MKWIIVAILFLGDVPANSKIFGGGDSAVDCEKERKEFLAWAKAQNADVWAACIEVVRPKPKPAPQKGSSS